MDYDFFLSHPPKIYSVEVYIGTYIFLPKQDGIFHIFFLFSFFIQYLWKQYFGQFLGTA